MKRLLLHAHIVVKILTGSFKRSTLQCMMVDSGNGLRTPLFLDQGEAQKERLAFENPEWAIYFDSEPLRYFPRPVTAPEAHFSKVLKLSGRISVDIILFASSKRRRLEATSSQGRFALAFEVGREKDLASAGQTVILID